MSTGLLGSHEPRRGRGGAGPRGQPRGQRRHGDAGADPGRGQHLRDLPVARGRPRGRPGGVQDRATGTARPSTSPASSPQLVLGILAEHDRHVVQPPARVPRRRRRRQPGRHARSMIAALEAPRGRASRAAARPDGGLRHRGRHGGAACERLFMTHPPLEERIAVLERAAR
ncbi:MAG: hypothetical protein MZU95_10580 [Desulfomicrobium escambiense]|nr:hypothetical protein [Desulfomicrobium escambiense]